MSDRYRLITRSDFDGLVCAVLLRKLELIDEISFAHPKDVQDGKVEITDRDILTNLPYQPQAHQVFDHHLSEERRNADGSAATGGRARNHVLVADAPSAARVVYDHFGGAATFPDVSPTMMAAVDQADAAQYDLDDILQPAGWALLNFIMDPRTGLGRFREFRISNYQLMMQLIDYCADHDDIDDVLAIPDVAERVALFQEQRPAFVDQLHRVTTLHGDLAKIDLRPEETIHAGNRFMVYALFPQARVSMHVMWGREKQNIVFAAGKSILDRSSGVDLGAVMLGHGGGGHQAAGTCQVPIEAADDVMSRLIEQLSTEHDALV